MLIFLNKKTQYQPWEQVICGDSGETTAALSRRKAEATQPGQHHAAESCTSALFAFFFFFLTEQGINAVFESVHRFVTIVEPLTESRQMEVNVSV